MLKFKLGELFCGAGGLALGAIKAKNPNIEIVHEWANDIDLSACHTYIHNICPNNPKSVICDDVRNLDIQKLAPIDCFAFGFPCNDFSLVGEQKGFNGKFGSLYQYGVEVLDVHKPKFFVAENVGGLASANNGVAIRHILNDFKKCGYKVYSHFYKLEEYGIPQARHRIIVVGIRNDLDVVFNPPSTKPFTNIDISSKTALEVPPIPLNAYNNEKTRQSKIVTERLSYIKQGENAFNANLPEKLKLNIKGAKISQIYKRLDPNKPSYTVTASGGGGTHIYHYDEPRALTNRERARLQTFPDDFFFFGTKGSVRKQIGMAVPPKFSQVLFECILKSFTGIPYDYISCGLDL